MNRALNLVALPLLVGLLPSSGAADTANALEVIPTAAASRVLPGATGRRSVGIGPLEFRFQLRYACRAPLAPRSLMLTVADTRQPVAQNALAGSSARVAVTLPAEQIAPVVVNDFCGADAAADAPLTLAAALAAQVSLRCGSPEAGPGQDRADDGDEPAVPDVEEIVYRSVPLDVVLVCTRAPDPPAPGS